VAEFALHQSGEWRENCAMMVRMVGVDRDVWAEAYKTVLDNFTEEEQRKMHKLANELQEILIAAKKRLEGK